MEHIKNIHFNHLSLLSCDFDMAAQLMVNSADVKNKSVFIHTNLFNYFLLKKIAPLRKEILSNTTLFLDGLPMKILASIMGQGWNPGINSKTLFPVLFESLAKNNKSVFLLGGSEFLNKKIVIGLNQTYPSLKINGFGNGSFNLSDEAGLIKKINHAQPDFLILGTGTKNEIDFINRNFESLHIGSIWNINDFLEIYLKIKIHSTGRKRYLNPKRAKEIIPQATNLFVKLLLKTCKFLLNLFKTVKKPIY